MNEENEARNSDMNRRSFLSGAALVAAGAALKPLAADARTVIDDPGKDHWPYLHPGEPVLQAPSDESMGVSWAVNKLSNGYVEFADNPELRNARRVMCGGLGVAAFNDVALHVRLTGLKPATRYWYRTITIELIPSGIYCYRLKPGAEVIGKTYSFMTLGAAGASHFCVIADTHEQYHQFGPLTDLVNKLNPAALVWNGDASNVTESEEQCVAMLLNPPQTRADYAARIPICFNNGNHEFCGKHSALLREMIMARLPSERDSRYWELRHNYAVRMGDIAVIGLDTGHDKHDDHPWIKGLTNFAPYYALQTEWLKDQFVRAEIRTAPFIVATCHIPLFDPDPKADDGTVAGVGNAAAWMRICAERWAPLFEENRVQLVVASHLHKYRHDAPTATRSWTQIVTGGATWPSDPPSKYPSVVEVKVEDGKMKVCVHNALTGKTAAEHVFEPRKV